jgi:hypothetical protein
MAVVQIDAPTCSSVASERDGKTSGDGLTIP